MDATYDSSEQIYQAHADVQVYERYLRRDGVKNRKRWLYHAMSQSPFFGVIAAASYTVGQMFTSSSNWGGLIPAFVFGFVASFVWALVFYESWIKQSIDLVRNCVWDCKLTESCYQFTDRNGVTTSIPWSLIKFEFVDPDYWEISSREYRMVIYRDSLRQAGLEKEFERRVGLPLA